jgi:RND family efflux transporter MFP subunit
MRILMGYSPLIPAILLLFFACNREAEQKRVVEEKLRQVKTVIVESTTYRIPVRAAGLLATQAQTKLSFKTGGIVEHVESREGRSVKKGEVLARLDLSEISAQVRQAGIGVEKAKRDLDRAGNLYRDSVATLEQYQNAQSAYELALAQKEVADFNLLHSTIKAPSDGKVQKVLVENNELVGAGYPVLLFASEENDWVVRVPVIDKDIVRLTLGDSARIRMDAFPGTIFTGEVNELGNVADPVSGTYEVELRLNRSRPQFRTGYISRVEISPRQVLKGLVVPVEALIDAGDHRAKVFVAEEGRAREREVRTGMILGDRVVIREGLAAGEVVITEGAHYLTGGERIDVIMESRQP